jgi:type II secretory pathway component PulF
MNKNKRKTYHVRTKERIYFTSNVATLLEAAVPIGAIFESLKETGGSKNYLHALEQMKADSEEGTPLWKVLDQNRIVPAQTLALIRLGEESGNLVQNMQIAAQQEEKQRVLKSKILSALLNPAFVFAITIVVGLGVAWFLLPRLSQTFSQLNVKLPLISRIVISIGNYLGHNGYWLVPTIIVSLIVLSYVLFAAKKTRSIGQNLLFHVPGIKRLLSEVEVARFGYLFGTLLNAGMTVTQSLQLMQEATATPHYKKFYKYLYDSFDNGESLKSSLQKYKKADKLIPPAVQQMIIAGERSGSMAAALLSIGRVYEEKSDTTTQNLEAILEPILLILVWLGVLIVAVAVILPIYSLVGGLEQP